MSARLATSLADVVAVVHLAYAGFIMLALLLVLMGYLFHWQWVKNRWFRGIHLGMIAIVVAEAWPGIICPLTTFEAELRLQAGQDFDATRVAQFVHGFLFYDAPWWVFTACYTFCGAMIVTSLRLVPVAWKKPSTTSP
jgi:hypothetical protein